MESISCNLNLNHQHTASANSTISLVSSPHVIPSSTKPAQTAATTALLTTDKTKSATSPSPLLPLPPSRPLFPSPLKFLWFGRENPSSPLPSSLVPEDDPQDSASADASNVCTCFLDHDHAQITSNAELISSSDIKILEEANEISRQHATDSHTQPNSADEFSSSAPTSSSDAQKNWVSRFLRLRLLWKASDAELKSSSQIVESALQIAADEADQALNAEELTAGVHEGKIDGEFSLADGDQEGICMLGAGRERVEHDRKSVSTFLHEVPVAEVQAISKLCLLSNLAYIIPEMQSKNLLKEHHLNFVTSSLVKKGVAEAKAALEKSARHASKKNKAPGKKRLKSGEECAVADRAPCDTESLQDNASSSGHLVVHAEASLREAATLDHAPPAQVLIGAAKEEGMSLEETLNKADKEARLEVQGSCPCEWFICDDDTSSTRYLVIQGSESLASWKTNLSFDPIKFEGLGVLVHRGVYEAAQGLYKMVQEELLEHIRKGPHAKLCFTGHSLGGSLATLLAMMLVKRGVVRASAVEGVVTLGAPCVLCAGERLLTQLGMQERQFVNVVMHRDIVPRAFACDYPDHVARLLKRVNGTFRDHPCLNYQRLLYGPVGQVMMLQPDNGQSPGHPLLPSSTAGLYLIRHPQHDTLIMQITNIATITAGSRHEAATAAATAAAATLHVEVRDAQRAFFNTPHPLDMLRDPGAYGFEGTISRDHDPRSYKRAINTVISQALRRAKPLTAPRRRRPSYSTLYRSLPSYMHLPSSPTPSDPYSYSPNPLSKPLLTHNSSRRAISSSHHISVGFLLILSMTTDLFSSFLSWV